MENKISTDFVIIEGALSQEVLEFISLAKKDDQVESFTAKIKGRLRVLTFKKSDIENFAEEFIANSILEDEIANKESFWLNKKIKENSVIADYKFNAINWDDKKMTLDVDFFGDVYFGINDNFFKKSIMGKSSKEIRLLLADQQEINKLDVRFWPFLRKSAPKEESRIEIIVNLNNI